MSVCLSTFHTKINCFVEKNYFRDFYSNWGINEKICEILSQNGSFRLIDQSVREILRFIETNYRISSNLGRPSKLSPPLFKAAGQAQE